MNQIIDGAYKYYLERFNGELKESQKNNPKLKFQTKPYTLCEFIKKCLQDNLFRCQWELKIEERELSLEERVRIYALKEGQTYEEFVTNWNTDVQWNEDLNDANTPTKLITITYNNEKIENYE